MIGYYNYTVILTYIGTFFGFVGVTYASGDNFRMALICLIVAGFCDMFDGKIASTMKRTKEEKMFGIQIDSLSDLICFGLLPALIAHRSVGREMINTTICGMYLLCALVRLAWFNVDEELRQNQEEGGRERYLGLPVTTSAILVPLAYGGLNLLKLPVDKILPWVMLMIAVAFVSPVQLKKPKLVGKLIMMVIGIGGLACVILGVKP